jgi:hypothetical protein
MGEAKERATEERRRESVAIMMNVNALGKGM